MFKVAPGPLATASRKHRGSPRGCCPSTHAPCSPGAICATSQPPRTSLSPEPPAPAGAPSGGWTTTWTHHVVTPGRWPALSCSGFGDVPESASEGPRPRRVPVGGWRALFLLVLPEGPQLVSLRSGRTRVPSLGACVASLGTCSPLWADLFALDCLCPCGCVSEFLVRLGQQPLSGLILRFVVFSFQQIPAPSLRLLSRP